MPIGDHLRSAQEACGRGDPLSAKPVIERVLASNPEGDDLARARLIAGEVYRLLGDLPTSQELLEALLGEWDRYPASRELLEPYALYNMGLVHRQRKAYANAIASYGQAQSIWEAQGDHEGVVMSAQNRAWVLCLLDRYQEAEALLRSIDMLVESLGIPERSWNQRLGLAHCALVAGENSEAITLAAPLVVGEDTVPAASEGLAHWVLGRALLAQGDANAALEAAVRAQQCGLRSADSRIMNDAAALRRRCVQAIQEGA